jgi:TorA maturation chaperone TorD
MKQTTTEEQTDIADVIEACKLRETTYGLLSRLYRKEIDQELLDKLHGMKYRVSTGNRNTDEGNRLVATYLSGMWENTVTELAADYMRTFFGHGYNGHAAAYPFESVYTSEKHLLMQDARDEVLALYRSAGLEKESSWKEGEDHLAVELEYMTVLAGRTTARLCKGEQDQAVALLESQRNFLDDHLLSWVPMMADAMDTFAKTDFYRGLGRITVGFLETDKELLDDLLDG